MSENVATPEAPAAPAQQATTAPKVVSPDLNFVNDVIKAGGESLKKCYQCATCTVVCNVTPDDNPFPRKEMVQAQWGLKDDLFRNPDIWLCHQCSDCTAHCPRGAKPGEVLGAIRQMSIVKHSKPGFMAKLASSPAGLAPLLAIPAVIFLIMMKLAGSIPLSAIPLAEGKISFTNMLFPMKFVDPPMIAAFTFGAVMLVLGIISYWKDMSKAAKPQGSLISGIIGTVKDVLAHNKFSQCNVASGRKLAHMLVFYSFIILAVTTTLAAIQEWAPVLLGEAAAVKVEHALHFPMKVLGNIGAVALLGGIILVILNRMATASKAGIGSYYDWLFIGVVVAVGATGFLAQMIRLAGMANLAYTTYFVHLVLVFFLFAYAPYTKMAHMLYRGTAMVFSRMTGRG